MSPPGGQRGPSGGSPSPHSSTSNAATCSATGRPRPPAHPAPARRAPRRNGSGLLRPRRPPRRRRWRDIGHFQARVVHRIGSPSWNPGRGSSSSSGMRGRRPQPSIKRRTCRPRHERPPRRPSSHGNLRRGVGHVRIDRRSVLAIPASSPPASATTRGRIGGSHADSRALSVPTMTPAAPARTRGPAPAAVRSAVIACATARARAVSSPAAGCHANAFAASTSAPGRERRHQQHDRQRDHELDERDASHDGRLTRAPRRTTTPGWSPSAAGSAPAAVRAATAIGATSTANA